MCRVWRRKGGEKKREEEKGGEDGDWGKRENEREKRTQFRSWEPRLFLN